MHNLQSYFPKNRPPTWGEHTEKSIFFKKAHKKVHFFLKYAQRIPSSPRMHAKVSLSPKKYPPNPDLASGLFCTYCK